MAWCRLAWEKLGVPVWYAKQITPSREFQRFRAYESIKLNQKEKQDWYFAALSQIVLQSHGGGEHTKVKDFLIDFGRPEPISPEEFERQQIAIWEAATGKKVQYKKGGHNAGRD